MLNFTVGIIHYTAGMSTTNNENQAVVNFRKYLQIPTVHPNVDYSKYLQHYHAPILSVNEFV